ncbi:MAG: GTPase ObgE [Bacillota bacterium]|nr:GTPase ObgE [Bacillota bacterium]
MFIDRATIEVAAGNGGDGTVSFRAEKYVPFGGPDGGDGGKGGDVVLLADQRLVTLQDFRYRRSYQAEHGERGGRKKMAGKAGADLVIRVPVGCLVRDAADGRLLVDMTVDGQSQIVALGGRGGRGNVHFANAVRQAPNFARPGRPGEELTLELELKLLADVGLVGFPNVGKSTLLSVITEARPKIANYPFTTLAPGLGIISCGGRAGRPLDERQIVVADIPGLIEGAAEGVGLGHDFLRHIERTRLLLHVVDVSGSEGRDPVSDYEQIRSELQSYDAALAARPELIVANKIDLASPEQVEAFAAAMRERGHEKIYPISAPIHEGVPELVAAVVRKVNELPPTVLAAAAPAEHRTYTYSIEAVEVTLEGGIYVVSGGGVEELMASINLDDSESLHYFQRQLRRRGVIDALEDAGIVEGETVRIDDVEFDYIP